VNETRSQRPSGEVVAVWALNGLVALAVLVTYWRLPPEELYHTSHEGLVGGLSRALVLLNYPVALIAIAIVGVLLERGAPRLPGSVAIALCAVTARPGVVDQDDLDARAVNAIPAVGVALALALTLAARPRIELAPRRQLDLVRIAVGALVLVLAVPWFFAELGFYAPDPVLADEVPPGEEIRAVHAGHHHGTDGTVLTLCALLLSRVARTNPLRAYLALMVVYGIGNALQDFWLEQLVKRGTTDVEIPSVLVPEPTFAWAVLLGAAIALFLLSLLRRAGSG
jgi:hypothetical protein